MYSPIDQKSASLIRAPIEITPRCCLVIEYGRNPERTKEGSKGRAAERDHCGGKMNQRLHSPASLAEAPLL
jgi:hypothetical protein